MNLIKKFAGLGMAMAMLLGATGCNIVTPATVGSIGGVEIPAGIYLLSQYNAYSTTTGVAQLATGETASDVKAVLKAECTGTIGDEEVTATGKDYVAKLTLRSLQYYAAVEKTFADLGGTLDDTATAEAASNADSLWESNSDVYQANGIGKSTVENYELNAEKAKACLDLIYGENGSEPVTDEEYLDYIANDCYYIESIQFPVMDHTTSTIATPDQNAAISDLADQCVAELNAATPETSVQEGYLNLYGTAANYLPQVFSQLGTTLDTSQLGYYVGSRLYTMDDLSSFQSGEDNSMVDALNAVEPGTWTKLNNGTAYLVVRAIDPMESYTLDELKTNFDLLSSMKNDELQDRFYELGASMEQALDQSAMNTYKASKIKRDV